MREPRPLLERHAEPAPRPMRRRWGVTVLLIAAALTGWALVKHCGSGGLADSEIQAGIALTSEGIATKRAERFREAEAHYVDAASVTVLDAYPAFLLHVNRELEAAVDDGEEAPGPVIAALLVQDWAAAREAAARVAGPETKPREFWERFVDEVEAASSVSAGRAPRGAR